MQKEWEIKDPKSYFRKQDPAKQSAPPAAPVAPIRTEKDPGRAYSLSMIAWGLGQLYNNQVGKGAALLVSMVIFVVAAVLSAIMHDDLFRFLLVRGISPSVALLCAGAFGFCILLFWILNAGDAYQRAARLRRTPFTGVDSRVTPVLASMVMPGWGEFLNGQPIKGSIYTGLSTIIVFAALSTYALFHLWPILDASNARFIAEGISAVSLCVVPFSPLLWVLCAYDAYVVSGDSLKKEPLRERIKAAYYRGRTQGWVAGVFPQIEGTVMLALFLTFAMIVFHYWFAAGFYLRKLVSMQTLLRDRGMTIVPELIGKLLTWVS